MSTITSATSASASAHAAPLSTALPAVPRTRHLILINGAELLSALDARIADDCALPETLTASRRDWPLGPMPLRVPTTRLTYLAAVSDNRLLVGVSEPRPDDPSWVAERLGEGRAVWRAMASEAMLQAAVDRVCEPLRVLLRLVEDPDCPLRVLVRLAAVVRGLADRGIARLTHDVRRAQVDHRHARLVAHDLASPFAELDQVAVGERQWRLCTTLASIGAAGREFENCLNGNEGLPPIEVCEGVLRGHDRFWTLLEDGELLAIAEVARCNGCVREISGHRNVAISDVYRAEIAALERHVGPYPDGQHEAEAWLLGRLNVDVWGGRNLVCEDRSPIIDWTSEQELREALARSQRRHEDDLERGVRFVVGAVS